MAWIDGGSFQYDSKGWSYTGSISTGFARSAGTGQSGLASLRATLGATATATYGFSARTEIVLGFCHKLSVLGGTRQLLDVGPSSNLRFSIESDGSIVVQHGLTEIGRTRSGIIQTNIEAYLEIRMLASATVGEVEIHLNGDPSPILNLTGQNTGVSFNQVQFIHTGGTGNVTNFSAWYFLDTTTAAWASGADDDFLGHIRYGVLDPTGNGTNSDLVGSDGNSVDNYQLVDDGFTNDGDTTYVQSAIVGDKDTYAMANMPTPPLTIYGVQTILIAKKSDAGTRAITPVIRSGGTDYNAATEHFLGTSYDTFKQVVDQNPDGPATWDETAVNAAEFGVEVTT